MYCVKCGVRLQDGVEICPLCETPVWNPESAERDIAYPERLPDKYRESGLQLAVFMTILTAVLINVILIVCLHVYGELRWGGYVVLGAALFYIIAVLPLWFRQPKGEIFVPIDHVAAALYVLYICQKTGGSWFMSFAFPLFLASALLSTAMICLLKYIRGGRLFIFGGFLILLGGFTVLVEFFEHLSFGTQMFLWSGYSLASLAVSGIFLIIVGMIPSLRSALEKRFFF